MTPRDYYAAAALSCQSTWFGVDRDGVRRELGTKDAVKHALAAADIMAAAACERWGHIFPAVDSSATRRACKRCGLPQTREVKQKVIGAERGIPMTVDDPGEWTGGAA